MTLRVYHEIWIESVHNDRPVKKTRGDGFVYQPAYVDKLTRERKNRLDLVGAVLRQGDSISRVIQFAEPNGGRNLSAAKAGSSGAGNPGRAEVRKSDVRGSREDPPR